MNKDLLKGVLLVITGAASYGILATIVGLAYHDGYNIIQVVLPQYVLGLITMGLLVLFNKKKPAGKNAVLQLMAGGTSISLTSLFYYLSVQYVPVSVGVVLLMQSIWMGVVAESLLHKKWPGTVKTIAVILVLTGTLMATNAIGNFGQLNITGVAWGLAAAVMYSISIYVSSRIALHLPPTTRSFWNLAGATVIVATVALAQESISFPVTVIWKYGIWLALFGTVLPPILLNAGLPKTGMGLGSILIAIEIPVSASTAHIFLHEAIYFIQWVGMALIIGSVIMLNLGNLKQEKLVI